MGRSAGTGLRTISWARAGRHAAGSRRAPTVLSGPAFRRNRWNEVHRPAEDGAFGPSGRSGQAKARERHGFRDRQLPQQMRRYKPASEDLRQRDVVVPRGANCAAFPLKTADSLLGYLSLQLDVAPDASFRPSVAALYYLATTLSRRAEWRQGGAKAPPQPRPRTSGTPAAESATFPRARRSSRTSSR